ncbi:unnamed protein product, partial [Didymodactylos carnosus]
WAHVVCALYIPEVEFENVETMEPIILTKMPIERYKLKSIRQIPPFKHEHASPENGRYNKQLLTSRFENKKRLFSKTTKSNSHLSSTVPLTILPLTSKELDESGNADKEETLLETHDQSTCRANHDDSTNLIRKGSTSSSSSCSPAEQSTRSSYQRRLHSSSSLSNNLSKKLKSTQNPSLTDLSQFVQLTKEERNSQFLSPQPPPPLTAKKSDDNVNSSDK